jgi:hypothetical protein
MHRTAPRPRVDTVNKLVPTGLADVIQRMMSIDTQARPQGMLEVQELLRPFCRARRWTFEFNEVLKRRLRRGEPSRGSRTGGEALRPTTFGSRAETDPPKSPRDKPSNRSK